MTEDMQECRQANRALKRSLDYAPVGLCYLDADLRYVHINEWLAKFNGLSVEAHVGNTIREVLLDVADGVETPIRQVIDSGEPLIGGIAVVETPAHPGVKHTHEVSYYPDVGADGSVVGVSCVVIDVGQREWDHDRFRIAVEASPMAMLMIDQHSKIVMVSDRTEKMFGYEKAELVGRSVDLLIPEGARAHHAKYMSEFLRHPSTRQMGEARDLTGVRKDGTEFNVEIGLNPGEGSGGLFVLASILDISERKRLEEERRALEAHRLESLGLLAGGIAHDFNNILVAVLGYSELISQGLPPESPVSGYVERVTESAHRAAELCSQMLAFSGKGRFVVAPRNLSEIVEVMGRLLEVSIPSSVVIRFDLATDLPAVDVDLSQIQQVVMNLITNSAEAIGDKSGVVTVVTGMMDVDQAYLSTTRVGEGLLVGPHVFLEISDTGCGMDEETLEKMFDPYFTTKVTGGGLGLAATQGIVRGHSGAIRVYSHPGEGTTIKVLLPCSDLPAGALNEAVGGSDEWRSTDTVLIVDDEEAVRGVLRLMCENAGCTVLTANHGREGVEVFREHAQEIDIVLLDMTMPYMSGTEAFREIRRIQPDARVILMSGHNEQEATSRFAGKGLAGFLQKPIAMAALFEKMQEVLD